VGFKENVQNSLKAVKLVLSRKGYLLTSIFVGLVVFAAMYYFLVANVADNDIWISVMMSGAGFVRNYSLKVSKI